MTTTHLPVIGGHPTGRAPTVRNDPNTAKFSLGESSAWFNARHMQFAMISLFWLAFMDIYVRMAPMGVITDLNTWD